MAESIVRKIRPFTIGTKLSASVGSKCASGTESYQSNSNQDPDPPPRSLTDQVYLYLGMAGGSPVSAQVSRSEQQQREVGEEAHLNQNAAPHSTCSRTIRKITISSHANSSGDTKQPKCDASQKSENLNNNNNKITSAVLPRIIGVSYERKPNSHFKVLLRKDGQGEKQEIQREESSATRTRASTALQIPVSRAHSPNQEPPKGEVQLIGQAEAPPTNDCCFTQGNTLFNKELQQAEEWMKAKLQEVKDLQWSPLQDGLSQGIEKDLWDFENSLIQLNKMGEQLLCRPSPTADQVRKQLAQLRDQWQALKEAAASQLKAVGGVRDLQEFYKKADRLEAWIKEKEEEQWLTKFQGENIDKMELTRKIVDLKEDERLYRSLHEEINRLALRLEKQGKTEGKNISTRRKHINKMWQRVQSLLKDQHENLQLALEVSSFYHDADNIISAISNKRKGVCVQNQLETSGDREIRDIGSQVMMLEVTVSQLSMLHPSLAGGVLQKLGEVKEGWSLLQRAVRHEKAPLGAPRPDDPLSPSKEQLCIMGPETQRIVGKEIKEEQNRLRGGSISSNTHGAVKLLVQESEAILGRNRKTVDSQDDAQNHASSVTGSGCRPADDIISRAQPERDREQMSQSKPRAPQGHAQPRPHLHMQLQKFNASADKTLSWLKDSIAVATQMCSTATLDGFNVAKQRQAALEQEIQSNAARIELVKKEGWSLVRAGHPGGGQIEEFLGQLEELWEELRRRHGRSQLLLQEAETLSLEVLRILLQLDALDCWLQGVEESLRGGLGQAEQDSERLEREVSDRGLQLRALRRDAERLQLRSHTHYLSPQISLRMQQVEERYSRVQSALSQQSTELRDSLMLSQFLERVEQEESQEALGDLPQTPRRETSPRVSPLGLHKGVEGEPLLESIGDPVEELREAVEMLNDTVRERGRSLGQEQDLSELFSRHSSLMARIMQGLSRAAQLTVDLLRAESDMMVRCEPDESGLQTLQEEQEELEMDLAVMEQEMEEMGVFSARPEGRSMGGACLIAPELQTTLQAWEELSRCSAENRARLHLSLQLHRFFQKYLAMISWTEDTRAYIFSDSTVHDGTGGEQLEDSEMDVKIEQKFGEFDELSSAGRALMEAGHHLSDLIQERMEELRSMLGWILVRWRSQKQQKKNGRKGKAEPHGDTIYSEATVSPALRELADSAANQLSESPGCHNSTLQTEDGYEVMGSMGMLGGALDPPVSLAPPLLLTQEPSAPSVGGATKPGDSHQMEKEAERKRVMETVSRPLGVPSSACRVFWRRCQGLLENTLGSLKRNRRIFGQSTEEVSTYLCATDSKAMPLTGGTVALPSPSCHAQVPASPSFPSSSYCSPLWAGSAPSHTPTLPILRLRRRSKRKRKWDVRRHTVQRIMGLEEPLEEDGMACSTHTWPLQVRKKREVSDEDCLGYLRNPLTQDIDAECSSQSDLATSLLAPVGLGRNRSPLRSGLNFDLQKGAAFIPSIPDIITIGPVELKPQQERPAPFSTFKQAISNAARVCPKAEEEWSLTENCSQNTSATIQSDHQSERSMCMGTFISYQSHLRKSLSILTTDQSRERRTSSSNCSPDQRQTAIAQCRSDLRQTKLSDGLSGNTQTTSADCIPHQQETSSNKYQSEPRQTTSSNGRSYQRQTISCNYPLQKRRTTLSDCISDGRRTTLSNGLSEQGQTTLSNRLSNWRQITSSNGLSEQKRITFIDTLSDGRQTTLSNDLLEPGQTTLSNRLSKWRQTTLSNGPSEQRRIILSDKLSDRRQTTLSNSLSEQGLTTLSDRLSDGRHTTSSNGLSEQRWISLSDKLSNRRQTTLSPGLSEQRPITLSDRLSDGRQTTLSNGPSEERKITLSDSLSKGRQTTLSNGLSEQRQITLSDKISDGSQTTLSGSQSDQTQTTLRDGRLDLQLIPHSGVCSLREEVLQVWDKMAGVLDFHRQSPKFSTPSVSNQEATLHVAAHLDMASTDSTHSPNIGRSMAALEKQSVSATRGAFMGDTVPPDHRQFEEEEEELKCIWRSSQTLCSDVMYSIAWTPPGYAHEPHPDSSSTLKPCPSDSALNYRTQATASAPTLLGPELHPPTVRHIHAYPSLNRPIKPHRKSWAAFPSQALPNREIPPVNETAANCVKLPYVQDPEKYIYQYKGEEEEEEGAEAGCPKVQSLSLLSVHMGGGPNAGAGQVLEHGTPARGAPASMESEPQVMQGTLEIKHRRQAGGKKAPCRTWSRFHTVLHRQTLHFYQHRKDTLQSSEAGLPLNLIGAECSPALEYSKRNYCLSLRLCDGSEYLLCASSRFLMKKWLLKIQANTGFSESDPSRSFSEPSCRENKLINIMDNTDRANDKEMAVLTRTTTENPLRLSGNLEGLVLRSSSDAGHRESYNNLRQAVKQRLKFGDPCVTHSLGGPSSKRRSQSFTSATYQKITPVPLNHTAYTGGGSRCSVTMVIGNEPAPTSSKMQQLIGWRQVDLQNSPGGGRSYSSLPRPRNKSVFRRIFGKKEWTHDL